MGADESGLHARPIILDSSDLFRRTIPSPSSKFVPFQTTEKECAAPYLLKGLHRKHYCLYRGYEKIIEGQTDPDQRTGQVSSGDDDAV